jgi:glycosyltransferase involved in cell wall biosynthesis
MPLSSRAGSTSIVVASASGADGVSGGVVLVIDALAARFGGTAYTAVKLTRALLKRDDVVKVVMVAERGSIVERGVRGEAGLRMVCPRLQPRGSIVARAGWEASRLPALVGSEQADALLTFSGMLPRHPRCRVIALLSNPVPFERRRTIGDVLRRKAIARTARRAHRIYTPSREMARLLGWPGVKVVPHGIDRTLLQPAARPGKEVLAVGDFYRHKRYDLVLEAWAGIPDPRPVLRLIGNPEVDPRHFEEIRRRAADTRILIAGRVPLRELLSAYRRARVLVIASEHESFAVPLAEAIGCGLPAVARDIPSLRETGGAGALYVRGDDPREWSGAITRLLRDDRLHGELRAAGLRHKPGLPWEEVAAAVVADATGP